jgi:hypothetical protein
MIMPDLRHMSHRLVSKGGESGHLLSEEWSRRDGSDEVGNEMPPPG